MCMPLSVLIVSECVAQSFSHVRSHRGGRLPLPHQARLGSQAWNPKRRSGGERLFEWVWQSGTRTQNRTWAPPTKSPTHPPTPRLTMASHRQGDAWTKHYVAPTFSPTPFPTSGAAPRKPKNSLPFPGARIGGASWVNGRNDLWLFGGRNAVNNGTYQDTWRFDTSASKWHWISGNTGIVLILSR